MEAMQSLSIGIQAVQKPNSEVGVDQISVSDLTQGPSKHPDNFPLDPKTQPNTQMRHGEFCGPSLPPQFKGCSPTSDQILTPNSPSMFVRLLQRNTPIKENIKFRPNMFFHLPQKNLRPLCKSKSLLRPDQEPAFYREVDMSDLPSQYAEDMKSFRQTLNLPDRRNTMSRSSTTIWALGDKKGQQEIRPSGPSSDPT